MCKKTHRKSNKFMIQLLAVILICVMLPMQAFAAEINSVDVAMPEKIETDDWTNISEEENDSPDEESLTGAEVIVQEESIITASEQTLEMDLTEEDTIWLKGADEEVSRLENCIVAFDPDDGKTGYNDFYKVTVPKGSTVTNRPENPIRDGYIFKGWYSCLDENDNPVLWDFKSDTVLENTTLWAAWEEACLVVFDPDDGKAGYNDFYKVTVPKGSTVTGQPENPIRDGYIFKGWYSYLDEEDNPVFWDFKSDIVMENTTLWAAWEKETNGGENGGGNGSDGNGGNDGGYNYIKTGNKTSPSRFVNQGNIPKTGDSVSMLLWMLCGVSVSGMIILIIVRNKKAAIEANKLV